MANDADLETTRKLNNFGNKPGPGRPKGMPNKTTVDVRNMLIASLDAVGGQEYLQRQAIENPKAYLSLVAKVIPSEVKSQITGADGGPVQHAVKVKFD